MQEHMIHGDSAEVSTKARDVMELEGNINHAIKQISSNKAGIKRMQKEITDRLMADTNYGAIHASIKDKQKELREAKRDAIKRDPVIEETMSKVRALRADSKMFQLSLNDYLKDLNEKTGQMSLTSPEGEIIELERVFKVKLPA